MTRLGPLIYGAVALDAAAGSRVCLPLTMSRYHQMVGVGLLVYILAIVAEMKYRPQAPHMLPEIIFVILLGVRAVLAVATIFSTLIYEDEAVAEPSSDTAVATSGEPKKTI
jgi:uncharacterized membrane protein